MSPGAYLRRRREAAGLSIGDVAVIISACDRAARLATEFLSDVEADRMLPSPIFVGALRGAFAFDRYVFRQLAACLSPAPELCRVCACSALDPCDDEASGACAWASPAHDLCTHCAGLAGAHPEEK